MMPEQEMAAGAEQAPAPAEGGGDTASQVAQLVSGISESMNLLGSIIKATPAAPEEAMALLEDATNSFSQAMQLMTGGQVESEGQQESAMGEPTPEDIPRSGSKFVPKTMANI